MHRIFIGYDKTETLAYHVLCHSLQANSTEPIAITPIDLRHLPKDVWWREPDVRQSTEFSFTRFLTPFLAGFQGQALYLDCDVLCRGDISELFRYARKHYDKSCLVVQHDYIPKSELKLAGLDGKPKEQHNYARKNWSSVILFNAEHRDCRRLMPGYVNCATGLELHQFTWTDRGSIGMLPPVWNHLVGEYDRDPEAKLAHFTLGGPWAVEGVDYADEWLLSMLEIR